MKPEEDNDQKKVKPYPVSEEMEKENDKVAEPAIAYGNRLFSYADYMKWPEWEMKEIINGIVYSFTAPLRRHASATTYFFGKAWNFIN